MLVGDNHQNIRRHSRRFPDWLFGVEDFFVDCVDVFVGDHFFRMVLEPLYGLPDSLPEGDIALEFWHDTLDFRAIEDAVVCLVSLELGFHRGIAAADFLCGNVLDLRFRGIECELDFPDDLVPCEDGVRGNLERFAKGILVADESREANGEIGGVCERPERLSVIVQEDREFVQESPCESES